MDELVDYFTATWINGNFPPNHWNYFNQHMPRTNNNVEGWHSRMTEVITKSHPNIFARIEFIRGELQVWSYSSATETPYEGEGEEGIDRF